MAGDVDFDSLRNLGPKSNAVLRAVGIHSVEQLRALDAVAVYSRIRQAGPDIGFKPSLNLLWALEGAISDRPWQTVAKEDRLSLLMQLEMLEQTP